MSLCLQDTFRGLTLTLTGTPKTTREIFYSRERLEHQELLLHTKLGACLRRLRAESETSVSNQHIPEGKGKFPEHGRKVTFQKISQN